MLQYLRILVDIAKYQKLSDKGFDRCWKIFKYHLTLYLSSLICPIRTTLAFGFCKIFRNWLWNHTKQFETVETMAIGYETIFHKVFLEILWRPYRYSESRDAYSRPSKPLKCAWVDAARVSSIKESVAKLFKFKHVVWTVYKGFWIRYSFLWLHTQLF